jgi:hypothetical protein
MATSFLKDYKLGRSITQNGVEENEGKQGIRLKIKAHTPRGLPMGLCNAISIIAGFCATSFSAFLFSAAGFLVALADLGSGRM